MGKTRKMMNAEEGLEAHKDLPGRGIAQLMAEYVTAQREAMGADNFDALTDARLTVAESETGFAPSLPSRRAGEVQVGVLGLLNGFLHYIAARAGVEEHGVLTMARCNDVRVFGYGAGTTRGSQVQIAQQAPKDVPPSAWECMRSSVYTQEDLDKLDAAWYKSRQPGLDAQVYNLLRQKP